MAAKTVSVSDKSYQDGNEGKKPGAHLMSRMEINDNKAGMEGLDKEKINQIIYETSKGSKFYENERKKEEQLDIKIQKLKSYANQIGHQSLHEGNVQADLLLQKLKLERDLSHTIVHIDMDAFYAAVEMRDNPNLRSKPMAVGGMGMLSTSNYLARKFGVRAAMPGFIGLKLCPGLVIVKPNFDKYTSVSHEVRKILALYDPNFCPMSLDEAYLDLGQHLEIRSSSLVSERTFILRNSVEFNCGFESICHCDLNTVLLPYILNSDVLISLVGDETEFQSVVENFDSKSCLSNEGIPPTCPACNREFPGYTLKVYSRSIEDAVLEMRNRIEQHTQLTASAGIAPNMMLAKICSDKNKPNGQYRIMPDIAEIESFMEDLPIRKVSGIGKVTEKLLGGLEVTKCQDISSKRSLLYHLFSPTSFNHFLSISLGIGSTTVERDDERKSISTEETFSEISDVTELCKRCEDMCVDVASDMKKENIKGKTVTLKLKTISFEVKTRSQTLPDLTNDPLVIFSAAKKLLLVEVKNLQPAPLRLRLMGVRMSKLVSTNNEQVTVNGMFNRYKEKEATSSKSQNQTTCDTFINRFEEDSLIQEEDDDCCEDFSRPVAETSYSVCSQSQKDVKRNIKGDTLSPGKTQNEMKKNVSFSSSSGNILTFFTRQKEIYIKKSSECTQMTPGTSEKSLQPVHDIFNKQKTNSSVNVCNVKSSRAEKNQVCEDSIAASSSNSKEHSIDTSSNETSTCPICGLTLSGGDLLAINSHIDSCLNRQTIRNILQDEKGAMQGQSSTGKRSRSEDQNKEMRHLGKVRKVQSSVLSFFQP